MVDCSWLETVPCVTLSLTRKDDEIGNDFWCNSAEQVASHTKIDFGRKLLATTVIQNLALQKSRYSDETVAISQNVFVVSKVKP